MPVPYMGSKRKSAQHIKNIILSHSKDVQTNTFVDLFCGGFAVSEEFVKLGWHIIANDKNKYVVALIKEVIEGKLNEEKCLEFISRDKFKHILQSPEQYEDRYIGYAMCLWSFGNNQKAYLLGKEREDIYRKVYNMVVFKEVDEELKTFIPQKYIDGVLNQSNRHTRRMAFKKVWNVLGKKHPNKRLQSLQSLESLERLERLERLTKGDITMLSGDYRDVIIPDQAIVYCDPPYKGTAEYSEGAFNHDEFREYIRKLSNTHKVFVSEYSAPEDFKIIYEFPQKSLLSAKGTQSHDNQPTEKVFVYPHS